MNKTLQLHLTLECRDRNGKLLWKIRRKSKSFVIAYFRNMESLAIFGAATGTCLDTAGVARTISASGAGAHGRMNAAAANINYGIVVGTGIGAVVPADYRLNPLIAHGIGAGQLQYAACAVGAATIVGGDTILTISRAFTNGSGAAITVNEIGIYADCFDNAATDRYWCFVRDLVVPGRVINNLATATATYTLSATA